MLSTEGAYDLAAYAERVADWAAPVAGVAAAHSLRTCFQLVPPPDDVKMTGRRAGLDAAVPAPGGGRSEPDRPGRAGLGGDRRRPDRFSRRLERPQERLLADLGRAARLFPPLESGSSAHVRAPAG